MAKQDWQKIWATTTPDKQADLDRVMPYTKTLRWQKMQAIIDTKLGGIRGLKTVEVGAGLGDFSLLLNTLGAKTTLADYSEEAVEKARSRYRDHGLKADFVLADMLNVPAAMSGKYDMSFSLGLAEHFNGLDRQGIVDAHTKVLRPGGLTFISVPYRYSFLYRLWMSARIHKGTWEYGLEIPFSKTEIKRLGEASGLKTIGFIQSSFFGDWQNFFPQHYVKRLFGWKIEKPSLLDHFGYALVYVGQKPRLTDGQ